MALCCYIAVEYLLSQILTNIDIATAAFNLTIGKTKHLEIMTMMTEMNAMTMIMVMVFVVACFWWSFVKRMISTSPAADLLGRVRGRTCSRHLDTTQGLLEGEALIINLMRILMGILLRISFQSLILSLAKKPNFDTDW